MTRTVTTALVLTFLLAINAPSFAQPTGPTTTLRTHPALERLLKNSKDGEPTVQLKGYVIQSSPETVRLYWDLTLSRYFEIPLSAVVDQVQGTDPEKDPVTLYVRASARIVSAISLTADSAASSLTADTADAAVMHRRLGNRFPTIPNECVASCVSCSLGHVGSCVRCATCAL
jgi:hypothetical protein